MKRETEFSLRQTLLKGREELEVLVSQDLRGGQDQRNVDCLRGERAVWEIPLWGRH